MIQNKENQTTTYRIHALQLQYSKVFLKVECGYEVAMKIWLFHERLKNSRKSTCGNSLETYIPNSFTRNLTPKFDKKAKVLQV